MNTPDISVIFPVYNVSKYLEESINSIRNQTLKNIEIICVNDGSTDDSAEILERLAAEDKRIIIINRDRPSGSAALPRNIGLERATGKYIICLDPDDYFDLTMLEKLYNRAKETKAEVVICDNQVVLAESGAVIKRKGNLRKEYLPKEKVFSCKEIPDTIFQLTDISCWDKLVSRELIERHGIRFQEKVPVADTVYYAILVLVLAERISVVAEPLIYYRKSRFGAQTMSKECNVENYFLACRETTHFLMTNNTYEMMKASWQERVLEILGSQLYAMNDDVAFEIIFEKCKSEWFRELDLIDIDLDRIKDRQCRDIFLKVMHNKFGEYMDELNTKLSAGSSVIIYGAGQIGKMIYKDLKIEGSYKIVLWCDKNADRLNDELISHPREIKNVTYDAIYIAIKNKEVIGEAKEELLQMGVNPEKIHVYSYCE